jgi:hypothetical protein
MIASPGTPAWALDLVVAVCTDAGVGLPRALRWRRRRGVLSTGLTVHAAGMLAVRAGTDELDQRLTLLHELAHWLRPAPRSRRRGGARHHGHDFYRTAFDLYSRYGVSADAVLAGEAARYPSALRYAVALGVQGAEAALAAHRSVIVRRRAERRPWRVAVAEHEIRLEREGRWTVCSICRQRIVGPTLSRLRRRRWPGRHTLFTRG